VSGSLTGQDGQPYAGMRLELFRDDGRVRDAPASLYATAETDPHGRFSFDVARPDREGSGWGGVSDFYVLWEGTERLASTELQFRIWKPRNVELPPLHRWEGEDHFDAETSLLHVPAVPAPFLPPDGAHLDAAVLTRTVSIHDGNGDEAWRTELAADGRVPLPPEVREDFAVHAQAKLVAFQGRWPTEEPATDEAPQSAPYWLEHLRKPVTLPPGNRQSLARGRSCVVSPGPNHSPCFATDGKSTQSWFAPAEFTLTLPLDSAGVEVRTILVRNLLVPHTHEAVLEALVQGEVLWTPLSVLVPPPLTGGFFRHELPEGTFVRQLRVRSVLKPGEQPPTSTGCCASALGELSIFGP
jgi:hypothetical protein